MVRDAKKQLWDDLIAAHKEAGAPIGGLSVPEGFVFEIVKNHFGTKDKVDKSKIKEDDKSLTDIINEITKDIPESEWDKIPRNASSIVGDESNYLAICPICNFALLRENNEYLCSNCNKKYRMVTKT